MKQQRHQQQRQQQRLLMLLLRIVFVLFIIFVTDTSDGYTFRTMMGNQQQQRIIQQQFQRIRNNKRILSRSCCFAVASISKQQQQQQQQTLEKEPTTTKTMVMIDENYKGQRRSRITTTNSNKQQQCRTKIKVEKTTSKKKKKNNNKTSNSSNTKNATGNKYISWEYRMEQLRAFHQQYGHCLVTTADEKLYPGLYTWTVSMRRYKFQVEENISSKDDNNDDDDDYDQSKATTVTKSKKRRLSEEKLQKLINIGFIWDVQTTIWEQKYQQLVQFYKKYSHTRVPNNSLEYPGLGIWVRNQRREHRKLILEQQRAEDNNYSNNNNNTRTTTTTTLTPERLQKLKALNFEWYKSHQDAWKRQYQQLKQFYNIHGHCNVPQPQYNNNNNNNNNNSNDCFIQLGQWCMNQRTQYRRYVNKQPTAMTKERIKKLEKLGFQWNTKETRWYMMLNELQKYYKQYGHINIEKSDTKHHELRVWLIWQRYIYNNQRHNKDCPLTDERITAIERTIPNFTWYGREKKGPSNKDWEKLFNAMRNKGFGQPNMKSKTHWFDGIKNPYQYDFKHTYTDEELLDLWNQDD